MNNLYYFNPISVRRHLNTNDVAAWSEIYKFIGANVGMNDRTGLFRQPVKTAVMPSCQLPTLAPFNLSYSDCVDRRVQELYEHSVQINQPIGIMWSGGIDSTMILVGFLRRYSAQDLAGRVQVITSAAALPENPEFYRRHVLPNFDLVNSNQLPWLFDGSMILVTGELNDQLFGSDLIRNYLLKRGAGEINSRLNRDTIFSYVNSVIDHAPVTAALVDTVLASAAHYGITLEKNTDFFWWYNFCFKWQTVSMRVYALTAPKLALNIDLDWHNRYLQHFYATDYFQLWSMNHPEVREISDFKHYKQLAKDTIYQFDHNEHYRDNKIKRPSLQTIFEQSQVCDAITDTFEFHYDFNPGDFYQADNQFKSI